MRRKEPERDGAGDTLFAVWLDLAESTVMTTPAAPTINEANVETQADYHVIAEGASH